MITTLLAASVGLAEIAVLGFLLLLLKRLGLPTAGVVPRQIDQLLPGWLAALTVFLASGVVQSVISRAATLASLQIAQDFAGSLRADLLQHFSIAPYSVFRGTDSSEISHLLTEDASQSGQAAQVVINILSQFLICTAYLIGTIMISPMAAVCVLLLAVPMLLLSRRISWKYESLKLRDATEKLTESTWDYGLNIGPARIHQAAEPAGRRVMLASSRVIASLLAHQRRITRFNLSQQLIVFTLFGTFIVLLQMSGGDAASQLLPTAVIYLRLAPRVQSLQQQRGLLSLSVGSVGAVLRVLRDKPCAEGRSDVSADSAAAGHIEIHNLQFEYEPGKPVLMLKQALLRQGGWTTVVGRSGIGKSTLMRLLTAIERPTSGQIIVGGRSLTAIDGRAWRMRLAHVEQTSSFFHGSLLDNLSAFSTTMMTSNDARLLAILQICGLNELIAVLPQGLSTVIDDRANLFSSGQKQRLALARALLRNPELLLLDEATNALDETSERQLLQAVRRYLPDSTVIEISHRASLLTQSSNPKDHVRSFVLVID